MALHICLSDRLHTHFRAVASLLSRLSVRYTKASASHRKAPLPVRSVALFAKAANVCGNHFKREVRSVVSRIISESRALPYPVIGVSLFRRQFHGLGHPWTARS